MSILALYAIAAGIAAIAFAAYKSSWIERQDPGNERMKEIGAAIREGAMAFLAREYKVLSIFIVIVAVLLVITNKGPQQLVALSFVVGSVCSGLAGYFGMRVATAANTRTTQGATTSLNKALDIAFSGGSVMGMCVVGLGLIGLAGLFLCYINWFGSELINLKMEVLPILSGFSLGASSIALFAVLEVVFPPKPLMWELI